MIALHRELAICEQDRRRVPSSNSRLELDGELSWNAETEQGCGTGFGDNFLERAALLCFVFVKLNKSPHKQSYKRIVAPEAAIFM